MAQDLKNTFIAHQSHPLAEMAKTLFVAYALDTVTQWLWSRKRILAVRDAHWGHLFLAASDYWRFFATKKKANAKMSVVNVTEISLFDFHSHSHHPKLQFQQIIETYQHFSMHAFADSFPPIHHFNKNKIFACCTNWNAQKKSKTLFSHPKTGWFICSQCCSCDGRLLESIQFSIGIGGSCENLHHLVGCLAMRGRVNALAKPIAAETAEKRNKLYRI